MKFREHGGGSVWDWPVITLPATMTALIDHLKMIHGAAVELMPDLQDIDVHPYFSDRKTPDERLGWDDTLLVVLKGYGVLGYVDCKPEDT